MSGRVLLTGATGFVGRQVLEALAARSIPVRAVVRSGKAHDAALKTAVEAVVETPDLFAEDAGWWQRACAGVDTVLHVAWYAEPGVYVNSPLNFDCLIGTLQLAKGAARAGVRRFVGVGTCFEYDLSGGTLGVHTPLRPQTAYGEAKSATFSTLSSWLPRENIEFAWCRLFYLYGEGEDSRRLVPYLRSRLSAGEPAELTSGTQIRDFLDVKTAGLKIVETALGQRLGPVNICSGVPTTVQQLAESIADEYGRRDLLKFGARPDSLADIPCVVGSNE